MDQDKVVSLIVDMMGVTMKIALPMLGVALILGLVAVVAIAGPWMLGTVVTWTTELWQQIPNYVGT